MNEAVTLGAVNTVHFIDVKTETDGKKNTLARVYALADGKLHISYTEEKYQNDKKIVKMAEQARERLKKLKKL